MPIVKPKAPRTKPAHPIRRAWQVIQSRWWSRWLVDLTLVALALIVVSAWQSRGLVQSGQSPPPLRLTTMEGTTVDLADLRGKPVVLAFWAPWCGVCRAESDNLSRVRRWAGGRVEVISVAVEYADVASVERYMEEQGVTYPVLLGTGRTVSDYRLRQFPTTYFIGADGNVRRAAVGYTTTLGLLVRAFL